MKYLLEHFLSLLDRPEAPLVSTGPSLSLQVVIFE